MAPRLPARSVQGGDRGGVGVEKRSGKMLAGAPKVRDPRSQQTIRSLWDPLYDFTEPDKDADAFSPMAGGVEGVVAVAGHRRIK